MPPAVQYEAVVDEFPDNTPVSRAEFNELLKRLSELEKTQRGNDATSENDRKAVRIMMTQFNNNNKKCNNVSNNTSELTSQAEEQLIPLIIKTVEQHLRAQPKEGWPAYIKKVGLQVGLMSAIKFLGNWLIAYILATPIGISVSLAVVTAGGYLLGLLSFPWVIGIVCTTVVVGGTIYYMSDTSDTKEKIS